MDSIMPGARRVDSVYPVLVQKTARLLQACADIRTVQELLEHSVTTAAAEQC
jgi:site-specific recombinase XerC